MAKSNAYYAANSAVLCAKKPVLRRFAAVLLAFTAVFGLSFTAFNSSQPEKAAKADLWQYVICSFDDWIAGDNADNPRVIHWFYENIMTDDTPRDWYFKSNANGYAQDVSFSLENLLSGKDYAKPQLDILNTSNNTSTRYTVYDRFGLAGLNFTNYDGEWNWWKIYYCRANDKGYGDDRKPEDGHLNDFYKGRDRPMDTWGARFSSRDPRVKQRSNFFLFVNNYSLTIANVIFGVAKSIVGLGNAMIEYSLRDFPSQIGFVDLIAKDNGIYMNLFNNLFFGMIGIMCLITGFYMLWKGMIHKQMREAVAGLLQFVLCFSVGVVMMVFPKFFVSLPNNMALVGQNIAMQALSAVEQKEDISSTICKTSTSGSGSSLPQQTDVSTDLAASANEFAKELERSSDAMIRMIECEYYRIFALTPYSLAQYGTNYKNLFAPEHVEDSDGKSIDQAVPDGASSIWRYQAQYAGDAAVPVGNGQFVHNWAVYQISTQTTNHISSVNIDMDSGDTVSGLGSGASTADSTGKTGDSTGSDAGSTASEPSKDASGASADSGDGSITPAGAGADDKDSVKGKYKSPAEYSGKLTKISGANTDWWRVVDALANYKSKTDKKNTNDSATQTSQDHAALNIDVKYLPVSYWNTWIGGSPMHRIMVSILATGFAIVGMSGVIALGLCLMAYSLACVMIMAFAPVALTFGLWAGEKGKYALRRFWQLLSAAVTKRIILGVIFVVMSLFIIKASAAIVDTTSYFKTMLLICVLSVVFAKNKSKIARMLAVALNTNSGGGMDIGAALENKANRGISIGANGLRGGVIGQTRGVGFMRGAAIGAGKAYSRGRMSGPVVSNFMNAKRKIENERNAQNNGTNTTNGQTGQEKYCVSCGKLLIDAKGHVHGQYFPVNGNYSSPDDIECAVCHGKNK